MPSIIDGQILPDNLYTDPKGRINYWRYRRPDRTFKTFQATLEQAIALATEANNKRSSMPAPVAPASSLPLWVERFIVYRQGLDPRLQNKQSWKNRKWVLRSFGQQFSGIALHALSLQHIRPWWDTLTPNAQRSRKPELNKLFNYLMLEGLVKIPSNPFSTADDKPRVLIKGLMPKQRKRLTVQQYWQIHAAAGNAGYTFLQHAMAISLHTGMRRGDIAELRWDAHVDGQWLKKQISKSHEKLGADDGANLRWNLNRHRALKTIIDEARELSLKHWRCPYVLSRMPVRRVRGKSKAHHAQVTASMISDSFTECARACGIDSTSFHEIRALASWLHKKAGHDQSAIQALMAHTSEGMTAHYQAGHETIWHDVDLVIPENALKSRKKQ